MISKSEANNLALTKKREAKEAEKLISDIDNAIRLASAEGLYETSVSVGDYTDYPINTALATLNSAGYSSETDISINLNTLTIKWSI